MSTIVSQYSSYTEQPEFIQYPATATETRRDRRKYRTPAETAAFKGYLTKTAAEKLGQFAIDTNDAELLAISDIIRETAKAENFTVGRDLVNRQTGELYDGVVILSSPISSTISQVAVEKSARRKAKRIRERFQERGVIDENGSLLVYESGNLINFPKGNRLRALTLTLPDLVCDAVTLLIITIRAQQLFKKRLSNRKNLVQFGQFTIEPELGKYTRRYNYHLHALIVSLDVPYWLIANLWTDCVETACIENGVDFRLPVETNRLNVYVQDVFEYAKKTGTDLTRTFFEISKYPLKSVNVGAMSPEELALYHRLFNGQKLTWSYKCTNHKGSAGRESEAKRKSPSLDKGNTNDCNEKKPRIRSALIRKGMQLIERGERAAWLKLLKRKLAEQQAFRRKQLVKLHPQAKFHSLSGRNFHFNESNLSIFSTAPRYISQMIH